MSSPRLSALPTRPGNITGWTATGKSTCIPITRPSGSSWHEAYRTYWLGKLLADGGRHEPNRTAGLIRTTELQSRVDSLTSITCTSADFSYFAKRYFPEPWGDRFGGIFHNLGGDWYNASDKYIQGHPHVREPIHSIAIPQAQSQGA